MRQDKYFRILVDVEVDGQDLGKRLIEAGLAGPYDGGKRPKCGSRAKSPSGADGQ